MIEAAELAAVPLLSTVPEETLARVARAAADLRLGAGEHAAHEGDPPAFFAVLEGKIEVTKKLEGVLRTIGARATGQIFGEIPIMFGTPFQGSFRAVVPSRVVRIEPSWFLQLVAASPEIMVAVGALAKERLGGLQGFATTPAKVRATLIGVRGDPACRALEAFLTRNQITFEWQDASSSDALPALRCEDGTTLVRARPRDVAEKLGLQTTARGETYDVVVIGGGPAGLAAGVYGASEGLRTIVVEREAPGGQAETSSRIENYLGFPTGVSGAELSRRALDQAKRLGAEIVVTRSAAAVDPMTRTVRLEGGEVLHAKAIVIATGVAWRRLSVDGFDRLLGKGVSYGASWSDAAATQGNDIHLVGAGNSSGQAALFFANHAKSVSLVVRGDSLEKSMSRYLVEKVRSKANIQVLLRSEVKTVQGGAQLESIDLDVNGAERRCESGGVFVFIGADAETSWLPDEIARDDRGYVLTGAGPCLLETSVSGIFACGDVRAGSVKRVAAAVGEGSMAIAFIRQMLGA